MSNHSRKKMKHSCLYCYELVENGQDFHPKCSTEFFGISNPPTLPYSLDQMSDLAKEVVARSVAVPGVQAKISMSTIKEARNNSDTRLTVVGALGGSYILKPPADKFPEMPENCKCPDNGTFVGYFGHYSKSFGSGVSNLMVRSTR